MFRKRGKNKGKVAAKATPAPDEESDDGKSDGEVLAPPTKSSASKPKFLASTGTTATLTGGDTRSTGASATAGVAMDVDSLDFTFDLKASASTSAVVASGASKSFDEEEDAGFLHEDDDDLAAQLWRSTAGPATDDGEPIYETAPPVAPKKPARAGGKSPSAKTQASRDRREEVVDRDKDAEGHDDEGQLHSTTTARKKEKKKKKKGLQWKKAGTSSDESDSAEGQLDAVPVVVGVTTDERQQDLHSSIGGRTAPAAPSSKRPTTLPPSTAAPGVDTSQEAIEEARAARRAAAAKYAATESTRLTGSDFQSFYGENDPAFFGGLGQRDPFAAQEKRTSNLHVSATDSSSFLTGEQAAEALGLRTTNNRGRNPPGRGGLGGASASNGTNTTGVKNSGDPEEEVASEELQAPNLARQRMRRVLARRRQEKEKLGKKKDLEKQQVETTTQELKIIENRLKLVLAIQVVLREFERFCAKLSNTIEAKRFGVAEAEAMLLKMVEAYAHGSKEPREEEQDEEEGDKSLDAFAKLNLSGDRAAALKSGDENRGEGGAVDGKLVVDYFRSSTMFTAASDGDATSAATARAVEQFHGELCTEFAKDQKKFHRACARQFEAFLSSSSISSGADSASATPTVIFQQFHLMRDTLQTRSQTGLPRNLIQKLINPDHLEKHLLEALVVGVKAELLQVVAKSADTTSGHTEDSQSTRKEPASVVFDDTKSIPIAPMVLLDELSWYRDGLLPFFFSSGENAGSPQTPEQQQLAAKLLWGVFEKTVLPWCQHLFLNCYNPFVRELHAGHLGSRETFSTNKLSALFLPETKLIKHTLLEVFNKILTSAPAMQQTVWGNSIEPLFVKFVRNSELLLQSEEVVARQRAYYLERVSTSSGAPGGVPARDFRIAEEKATSSSPTHPFALLVLGLLVVANGWYRCFQIGEDSYKVVELVARLYEVAKTTIETDRTGGTNLTAALETLLFARDLVVNWSDYLLHERQQRTSRGSAATSATTKTPVHSFLRAFEPQIGPLLAQVPTSAQAADLRDEIQRALELHRG
ncbi:unnamed protein product [Amoebophrya sp. A120]|nr:unnamed protein product [Amoebophrya sp. A120]|eukprot:GSA120T00021324001.1